MNRKSRLFLVTIFALAILGFREVSAFACTAFGGPTVWDDQIGHMWDVSQSGNTLSGSEYYLPCGTGTIDPTNSSISNGAFTMKVNYPPGCPGSAYAWVYSNFWSVNCDVVDVNYYEYNSSFVLVGSGSLTLIGYALDETSNTSASAPPNDWSGTSYNWKATAVAGGGITDRHFAGRYFWEENVLVPPSDNCWWDGINVQYRYDSLNKNIRNPDGSTGPWPNSSTWQNPMYNSYARLNSSDSWPDTIGPGPGYLVAFYRQNSPNLIGISNASCTATVTQRMWMVADWGAGNHKDRYYQDNSHTLTIFWDTTHPNNDFDYWDGRSGSTMDWNVGSNRTNLQNRSKLWPLVDPPANLHFDSVSSTAISLGWNAGGGDTNEYEVWRSTDGASYTAFGSSTSTSLTDSTVSSGNQYWYCVRSGRNVGNGDFGTLASQFGPCSSAITAIAP